MVGMFVAYKNPKHHVMSVLARRGPRMARKQLLMLLRHNHSIKTLRPILDGLVREGLVYEYRERHQGQYRVRQRWMVALTDKGEMEMMLA